MELIIAQLSLVGGITGFGHYRVSDPMLNPVPKSVHFLVYLNFGALLDIFLWSMSERVQLSIGYMAVNIELAKFV